MDWHEANLEVVKRLQAILAIHGKDSIGVVVSPRLTNEELFVAGKLADALQTSVKTSFSVNGGSGLEAVFGYDASTNSFAELNNSDFVLTVGEIKGNHPVMDFKIRATEIASVAWPADGDVKAFVKALLELADEQQLAAKADGSAELKASLAGVKVTEAAKALAERYSKAKKPIILIDEDTVGQEAVKLFAAAAVLAGKVGAAYRGIVLARSKNNTQGAIDMGFVLPTDRVIKDINGGKIKALVVIGENPAISPENVKLLSNLSFLAVYDIFMTETAAAADVVLPLVSSAETEGTYTRSDRLIQAVHAALRPKTGKDNLQVLLDTAGYLGINYNNLADVRNAMVREVPVYAKNSQGVKVLYAEGFATDNKKAVLSAASNEPIFATKEKYDTLELYFEKVAKSV